MYLRYVSKVMAQKRSRDQLIARILTICQEDDVIKTRIVYQVGLNFKTVQPHLNLLLKKGLLEVTGNTQQIYKTTPEGGQALESLRKVEAIYS
jgi:predicted transcriptional regulator